MIIVYRKKDGVIMNGPNTNTAFPEGGPSDIEIANVVSARGGNTEDYGIFRLHDVDDNELVAATLRYEYSLEFDQDGRPVGVIIGQLRPAPGPLPPSPRMTEEEKEALLLAQSEMIALLFERLQGGSVQ